MTKFLKIKGGFIVDETNDYFKQFVVITVTSMEAIENSLHAYDNIRFIYGEKRKGALKKIFENPHSKNVEELESNEEVSTIFKKVCDSIDEDNNFQQEMADLEWEMSMVIHHGLRV